MPNHKIDFIRVRQYIVDRIMTSETKPVHFPPTRKLAEMFQVSQPTALRAVKDLIKDGYLLPCRGGGSVSTAWSGGPAYQLFGLVAVSGQQSMDDYFINRLYSAMALEITGNPFFLRASPYSSRRGLGRTSAIPAKLCTSHSCFSS